MSLREEISGEIIANTISMDDIEGHYILVEGEKDVLFYSKFLDNNLCSIEICHGKENVINAIKILNNRSTKTKYFGLVDSDYDYVIEADEVENVIKTDYHSVETMCLRADSFENFINEYFDKKKLLTFSFSNNKELVDYVLQLAKPLSEIRILSLKENFNFKFKPTGKQTKELDYTNFICKNTFQYLGIEKLLETVKRYFNQGVHLSNDAIIKKLGEINLDKYDIAQICHGHDITNIIIVAMKKALGKSSLSNIKIDEIERAMRLAYTREDFNNTEIKKKIERIDSKLLR